MVTLVTVGNTVRTVIWNPNKTIDLGQWSTCGAIRLERISCVYMCVCMTFEGNEVTMFSALSRLVLLSG